MEEEAIKISVRHETARRYAEAGIPVFPCGPDTIHTCVRGPSGKCAQCERAKRPATPHGFHDASADLAQIDAWWAEADYNIGLEPELAGWSVVDVDIRENWDENAAPTYTVASPSDGRHLYYRGSLRGSVGKLATGVDTRGRGSYVLVPPSIVGGASYRVVDDRDPAPLPAWIAARLGHAERVRASAPADIVLDTPAQIQAVRDYLTAIFDREGPWGQDDPTDTFAIAAAAKDGGVSETMATELMMELLAEDEREWLAQTVANAYHYGQNEPGCGLPGTPERKYAGLDTAEYANPPSEALNAAPLPLFRSWASIRDAHFEPPQWVWQDRLLAFEPNLYTGDAGVGKTTLAENLAVATACGIPLLGQPTRRMPVALLVAEDHYGPVRDNLAAIAQTLGDHPGLEQIHVLSVKSDRVPGGHLLARITDDGRCEDTPFMRERVAPFLASLGGEVLWIVDPLAEFIAFNNLSDQACRTLATTFLASCCAINGNRVTVLVNDHPSKAGMAAGHHYAGSVQLKAAFSLMATLIGGEWSGGKLNRQRKLSFVVKKGRYAAEDKVDFYRTGSSPAFTLDGLPGHAPRDHARRVYQTIIQRHVEGLPTGNDNRSAFGPGALAREIGMEQPEVEIALSYCRRERWLVYSTGGGTGGKSRTPSTWMPGSVTPLFDDSPIDY